MIPTVKELAAKYADKGLLVIGASLDAKPLVLKFKEKHGITYPIVADSLPTAKTFGLELYPTAFVVDKDGKIVWKGDVEEPTCVKAIESALAK